MIPPGTAASPIALAVVQWLGTMAADSDVSCPRLSREWIAAERLCSRSCGNCRTTSSEGRLNLAFGRGAARAEHADVERAV